MLLKITEKCSMGCSHCINSATENGEHMSLDTFKDAIDFIIRNNAYHSIFISGGEPTEHPMFPFFMGYLLGELTKRNLKSMVTITTNGFWIIENEENMKCAKNIASGYKDVHFQFQVSTDSRYYPKKLDTTKRIWREEGFVLCTDCVELCTHKDELKKITLHRGGLQPLNVLMSELLQNNCLILRLKVL